MKAKPAKKTRKSLKIKYVTNEDMPKYMKAEDFEDHSDEEHAEAAPNVQQPEFFEWSSNKCDVDTAEAHDVLPEIDEGFANLKIDTKSDGLEKPNDHAN